ncbi:MAG: bacillithiol system redox-active protein YtxJ [Ignavibacteria bacterium]|nr:bacillithiol system redox-active protein YtxJ [Ignavibacteria bacterium]
MNWIKIENSHDLEEIIQNSFNERVLLFKYSPRCSINYIVKNLLEREWAEYEMNMKTFLVDVIACKELSNQIETDFGIKHESPQVLIIENSKIIFYASHGAILYSKIRKFCNKPELVK